MNREILFVGSVPLKPAAAVFEHVCQLGLAPFMKRIPDGEQGSWDGPLKNLPQNEAFEPIGSPVKFTNRPSTFFEAMESTLVNLKPGVRGQDVIITELGIARNAAASYPQFKQAKAEGKLPPETRFCVTMAGPGTSFSAIALPPEELFPLVERVYCEEIRRILDVVPVSELSIQLDLAGEVEIEEYRRRPGDYDMPLLNQREPFWPMAEAVATVAAIADSVPTKAELGFHLCALYHIDESQGQDLNVHVDWCNALTEAISRRITYIHIPTAPSHDERDFQALARLRLSEDTKLFIGVIHLDDGVEGARRRIAAAEKFRLDFGIASFCGLGVPSRKELHNPHPISEVFEIHRLLAEPSNRPE